MRFTILSCLLATLSSALVLADNADVNAKVDNYIQYGHLFLTLLFHIRSKGTYN